MPKWVGVVGVMASSLEGASSIRYSDEASQPRLLNESEEPYSTWDDPSQHDEPSQHQPR